MTTPPLLAPPEAQPHNELAADTSLLLADPGDHMASEALARPFRLGIVGLGAATGLGFRLAVANGYSDLDSRPLILVAALTSAIMGVGLLAMAAERDRVGAPLAWISVVTALAWGALNWISPPFVGSVTVWSRPDQVVLSILGVGNGLLLAGLITLAFVRRRPTLSVAATMLAAVAALASNTVVLRSEWPAIVIIGLAFALVLLAWDRSPRREHLYVAPEESPRISRAALSFISVALCGTAIQLWLSRMSIPRSVPAVGISLLLVAAAFASMVRVRREIERRETTLSEWTSWMREIRTSDFRAEMENFESAANEPNLFDPRPPIGFGDEERRALSFPNLTVTDEPIQTEEEVQAAVDEAVGAFGPADLAAAAAELEGTTPERSTTPSLIPDTAPMPTPAPISADQIDAAALDALWSQDMGSAESTLPVPDVVAPKPTPEPVAAAATEPTPEPGATIPEPTAEPTPELVATAPVAPAAVVIPRLQLPTMDDAPEPDFSTLHNVPMSAQIGGVTRAADAGGAFSAMVDGNEQSPPGERVQVANLAALGAWLNSPVAAARTQPLLVAIEAMSLDEFDSLPSEDALMATEEIGAFLADTMPTADLVSWIDGPYFIVAHASKTNSEVLQLNTRVRASLKPTDGALVFLRPGANSTLDELVDEAVMGLLQARRLERRAQGR